MANAVIASEDKIVWDENLGIHRKLFAGQPVPPDLVEAYKTDAQAPEAGTEPADGDDPNDLGVDELKARVDELGIEVEGSGQGGRVLKEDLVNALKAHASAS